MYLRTLEGRHMTTRTTQSVVRVPRSFRLDGFANAHPPGEYRVDREEELIEGLSWTAWRRIGTFIHLPAIGIRSSAQQMVRVDPSEIEAICEQEEQT
jgi:hypothetical protein